MCSNLLLTSQIGLMSYWGDWEVTIPWCTWMFFHRGIKYLTRKEIKTCSGIDRNTQAMSTMGKGVWERENHSLGSEP